MITSSSGIGFNPLSALKTAARTTVRVAADPGVQQAAMQAGQRLAPQKYATASQYATQARDVYRRVTAVPGQPQMAPMPMPMPEMAPPEPKSGSGMITMAAIGAGLLLVIMLTRR